MLIYSCPELSALHCSTSGLGRLSGETEEGVTWREKFLSVFREVRVGV